MNNIKIAVTSSFLSAAVVAGSAFGAVDLSDGSAPSWFPMTMTSLKYNTATKALYDATAQNWDGYPDAGQIMTSRHFSYATSDLLFAASGTFGVSSPYGMLDGTYYSREFGWYSPGSSNTAMQNAVAGYASGAAVWVKVISISDGLKTYLAVGSDGLGARADGAYSAYQEILSSAGAIWKWDYMMDHNTQSIDASYVTHAGQTFSATYYVYIGDSSGNEIFNTDSSSTGIYEIWNWTVTDVIPTPEPASLGVLSLAGAAMLLTRRK